MSVNQQLLRRHTVAALICAACLGLPVPAAPAVTDARLPLKVAVFKHGLGGNAVQQALSADPRFQAVLIDALTAEELLKHDVLFVGSYNIAQPEQVQAVKTFTGCGGGLILNHAACGRQSPSTLFPDIAVKVVDRRADSVLVLKDGQHPLGRDLPGQYPHAFIDHLYLEPGSAGSVVLVDREGSAVVVAGAAGAGRVVFNGSLPGYWYDPADYRQAEQAPAGPELQLVVNMIAWAGERPLTALAAEELAARRNKAEADIKLEELSRLLPNANWFGQEMIRGSYLAMPPVHTLGGRYFITYDATSWRNPAGKLNAQTPAGRDFFIKRLKLDVMQFKWLGITDIIYWTDFTGGRVSRDWQIPDLTPPAAGMDPLEELIRLATPEGLNVWVAWHPVMKATAFAEKYGARDEKGALYKYANSLNVPDLVKPAYLALCRQLIDGYASTYKPMGNFKGILTFDELWFTYADFHGDDLAEIAEFCRSRFGEKLPADFSERLARGVRWSDPADPWRRRYILFKQQVVASFLKTLVEHCHQQGLQMGIPTVYYPGRWFFGFDNVALAQAGADYLIGNYTKNAYSSYPNTLRWSHHNDPWGLYDTANLRGGPGGLKFTFCDLWRLIMYGNDPAQVREFARNIYNLRLFADAEPLERAAFLIHEEALEMLAPEPSLPFNRATALLNAAQHEQPVTFIYSRDTGRFGQYRVLVATPYATRGLPVQAMNALRQYVEQGGIVLSVNADWSVARADMADEQDRTAGMLGVSYGTSAPPSAVAFKWQDRDIPLSPGTPRRAAAAGPGTQVLATFSDGTPAITVMPLGQGKVVALHFDAGAELSKDMDGPLAVMFKGLLRDLATPPVVLAGPGAVVQSALKKGRWLAVALYPEQAPAELTLKVDVRALGIPGDEFRMIMLGKQMEITRPGDLWGSTGFWTADDLKAGFHVTITEDQKSHLPLPESFDTSDFKDAREGAYFQRVMQDRWDKAGSLKRDYSHEVVVIAPADEPAMPGVNPTVQ